MTRKYWMGALFGLCATWGCGDDGAATDDTEGTGDTTGGGPTSSTTSVDTGSTSGDTTATTSPTTFTTSPTSDSTDTTGPPPEPADFLVRITNVSDQGQCPTPISPGLWMEQDSMAAVPPLFVDGFEDMGEGLEALAEDGDPSTIAAAVMGKAGVIQSGTFTTPVGAVDPAPIMPGESYEVTFTAQPFSRLGLATMFAWSNDLLIATGGNGVGLFQNNGSPQSMRDITQFLLLMDVGTEINQAPGQGPDQAPLQAPANTGAPETGAVTPFTSSTRALPLAAGIADVTVAEESGTFTITVTNISGDRGTIVTPLSPLLWATHDDTVALFTPGSPAPAGLESLAEDGDATALETALTGGAGIDQVAVAAAPAAPGETFEIVVTPVETAPLLSLASMVGETNDAFLAPMAGVALLDENGNPRSVGAIEDDFAAMLAVWDAGTEANEVPGVGPNQPGQSVTPNVGAADPDDTVRLYRDATNDLAGADAGGLLTVEIVNGANAGEFDITITNTSGGTVYPGVLTPLVYMVHDDTIGLFTEGMPASPGVEDLAEDGVTATLLGEVMGMAGVGTAAVIDTPDGAVNPGPLGEGDAYSFTITADTTNRYFSFASMVVPSNDTFAAFGPMGVQLFDDNGALDDATIATNIAASLAAWDAGTEANQSGAIGRDQAPRQETEGDGVNEGPAVVHEASEDPVWVYCDLATVVEVTVEPVQ